MVLQLSILAFIIAFAFGMSVLKIKPQEDK